MKYIYEKFNKLNTFVLIILIFNKKTVQRRKDNKIRKKYYLRVIIIINSVKGAFCPNIECFYEIIDFMESKIFNSY